MRTWAAFVFAAAALAQQPFAAGPAIDAQVEQAIGAGLIPGAVVVIGHQGKIVYHRAYGSRSLVPNREPMTEDTIFDAASLTKVVATTSAMMKLFEQGRVRMNDPVTAYIPEFEGGKSPITVRDLMTHFSGLRPDLDLKPAWSGYETGIRLAFSDKPAAPPGVNFVYSDINFIMVGEIVRRVSGQPLPEFVRQNVFAPLGMSESMFNPPASLKPRIAPTELDNGVPLRGVVHDETARYMGGVAGHAGLFTTAADLAIFCEMMLEGGERAGVRVFSAATVRKFTTPQTPADQPILRGFGWDIDSPFSGNRGELFPIGSYGHTGFTGTSIWMDPSTNSYVILLANSVHPHRGKNITPLRSKVATAAAAAFGIQSQSVQLTGYEETIVGAGLHREVARNARVLTGLDVLATNNFAELRGKRVGLITNHTGLSRDSKRNIDLMTAAGIKLTAIFSPEHGITGKEDTERIADSKDPASGVPIFSLYQANRRRIAPEMLANLDALVFDIQDVGARFYTYSCTMMYALEEAAKSKRPFYVLDRPNPITGVHVEGPILDADLESFVGCFELPVRHGMTFGELARMMNGERRFGADLHVIPVKGWERGDWWDSTGLTWVDPSPNIRGLNAALLYPGIAMLEASGNYSVGRGTDAPFEQVGADWMNGEEFADYLNKQCIPGVRVYATRFTPSASNFSGKSISGVRFVVTDRNAFNSLRLGLEIATGIARFYAGKMDWTVNRFLVGNRAVLESLRANEPAPKILGDTETALKGFLEKRKPYLIY
jgi:uncharacterized protein YbbC (DUF1343 family)/CubicO group peptidase (beta-lactamase class C family)